MKPIALYLPAFHKTLVNDQTWGENWTEWDNLRRWKPQFDGHILYRPHQDIGEYDLLNIKTRRKQAEIAKKYGIYGFGVYHYWFNRELVLEQPYELMLLDNEPNLPFFFIWANETWSKRWDGSENIVIKSQTYGDEDEWYDHAIYLKKFLEHGNYISINNNRVIGLYRPATIPRLSERINFYKKILGNDIIFLSLYGTFPKQQSPGNYPYLDGCIEFAPFVKSHNWRDFSIQKHQSLFYGISPGFDNSPRCMERYTRFYAPNIRQQLEDIKNQEYVFINAWNEWGEQAVIEPSDITGYSNLETISEYV